ncbi:MAG: dienelactone hydrolase [Acidimicrobiaceae bacterium]|nr:dienelactone hydrolase [Acidimicrobiaceae bacterium]MDE0494159.1 dienelactone hydrolase [Acidimicrobiaceae bacterium]MYA13235.1 dienelactone hydrolase [Acidimicrobiaceae bacterium]
MQADRDFPASSVAGVLLTHGAGGGADQHTLVALDEGLDMPVRRIEFGYRREGRRFPDRAPRLIETVRAEAEAFASDLGTTTARLVLGGRSMGGRMCSMAVAEGLPAAGLALLSYPLHPPGKPDKLRVEHFGGIEVPTLFVSGDRDPFGTPEEFASHLGAIPGSVTVHWLEGQGHNPKPKFDTEIVVALGAFLDAL